MKNILIFTTLLSSLISGHSFAESKVKNQRKADAASEELYKLFDSEIFSLSKKNENAFDAASSIYVLSSEDLRRSGSNSIPEALRLVPGLQVARIDGHKWAISSRGFNSQFSNKMLVMVDGRTVYTPVFSGSFWDVQDYLLEDVDKIEVIRGSGGAIWGANAVNGIINIITKNAVDSQGGYASGTIGNQDRFIGEVRYGGVTKDLNHYRVYAKQLHRGEMRKINGNRDNDDGYRQSQAGFRYDIRSIQGSTVAIHGDVRQGKANDYFDFTSGGYSADEPTHKNSRGANIAINWERDISKKSSFTLQTYIDYDQFDTQVLARDGRTADIDFQYFYDFNKRHHLVFGAGYRLISDKINEEPLTNDVVVLDYRDKRSDQIFSAFLQDKIGLIADVLYLTIGSKFENNDYTGFEFQPSAKLTLFPSRTQTAWASVSRAVRTPTRAEESISITLPSGTKAQAGDSDYESEEVIAYEAGYRIKPTRTSLIDVAFFYNDYSKLRTFNLKNGFGATTTNFGEGESYGAEITAKLQANNNWRLEAGYEFLKLDVRNNRISTESSSQIDTAEGESPEGQFRLRSNYNITPKVEFDNIYYYVDSLPNSGTNGVPSYSRFDTRIGYLFSPNIEFSIGAQNITDRRHQEFKGALFANSTEVGRTIYFKTVVRFW
jgi:iron complex outermembrane receptor protein